MKKILGICGSTRKNSTNHRFIKAIEHISKDFFELQPYVEISLLPHFNPDEESENIESVNRFKSQLQNADGVIICTPEYAHGVPGSLKNAIDWTVGTSEFSGKPTALITASTDGKYAHSALLETLRVIEAKDIDELQLLIPFASAKINTNNMITDEKTLSETNDLIKKLRKAIDRLHKK